MKLGHILKTMTLSILLAGTLTNSASAAPNTSRYTMSRSGSTIAVNVTNSDTIDSVEARFTYAGDVDAFTISVTNGTSFGICIDPKTSGIACSSSSAIAPGSYRVATITLTPKSGVNNATVSVSVTSSSSVLAYADGSETLNKSSLPSITYTFAAPQPSTPAPTAPSNPTVPSNAANNNSAASGRTTGNNNTATPATSTESGEVAGEQTVQSEEDAQQGPAADTDEKASTVKAKSSNKNGLWIFIAILAAIAFGYALPKRKPAPKAKRPAKAAAARTAKSSTTKRAGKPAQRKKK